MKARVTMHRSLRAAMLHVWQGYLLAVAMLVAPHCQAAITYFHNDQLGSPLAATDAAGNLLWTARYEPYGFRQQSGDSYAGSLDNRRWFAGHVEDAATGLTYMQGRYYDARLGRFISADPAPVRFDDPGTFNRYVYAFNNPYRYRDPDGREALAISLDGSFILGAGLGAATGVYVTFPAQDDAPLDIGTFQTVAAGAGMDVSFTGSISVVRGSRENFEGTSAVSSVTVPLTGIAGPSVDYETIVNVDTGEWAGQSVGFGVSAAPSASVTAAETTVTFSLRDYLLGTDTANPNTYQDPSELEAQMWYGFIAG